MNHCIYGYREKEEIEKNDGHEENGEIINFRYFPSYIMTFHREHKQMYPTEILSVK